jgi:hypothetical protein
MASTYSANLAIELIGTGDQAGAWGNTTNTNLGTLIEQAISGYVTQAVSTGNDTSITIPNGATGVARNMYIELTGTGGTNTNLIVPANKKLYFIFNNASGAVTVKVAGQTGVSVAAGRKLILVSNGTDVIEATSYVTSGGTISFDSLVVTNLAATSATITTLNGTSANITTLSGTSANITTINGTSANITTVTGTTGGFSSANITTLGSTSANITTLSGTSAVITTINGTSANITTVTGTTGGFSSANITTLGSTSANITTLTGTSATITTILDGNGNVRAIPRSGSAKTSNYTLAITDVGEFIELGTGGIITVPNGIFATGDVISVFNNTTGARPISLTITTAYQGGTDADKAVLSLATRGVATILFLSNSVCVVNGNVS